MFELRSLQKTVDEIYKRIIDYYDADVFLLCQRQFGDDEELVKLFSRKLVKSEFYTRPDPAQHFRNSPKLAMNSHNNWNKPYVLQPMINLDKCYKFIQPYVNDYDYFISLRVDVSFLFDLPPPDLFEKIPHGLYSFNPEYCRWWGGSGTANFIHKSLIKDYLNCVFDMMTNPRLTPILQEAIRTNNNFNAESLMDFSLRSKRLTFIPIYETNYYITYTSLDDYYTWGRPSVNPKYPDVKSKYHAQYDNALSALNKWDAGWRWGYENNAVTLVAPTPLLGV